MFFDRQVLEQVRLIRNKGELRLRTGRIVRQISSRDTDPASARNDDSGQASDGRGLACAVGPDQAEHLSRADLEGQPLDGGEVAIQLLQPLDFDHWPPWSRR